jgi:hypothetical protein
MKIKASEIKSAYCTSPSPLIVSVLHTDGSSQESNVIQLSESYTDAAQEKIMVFITKGKD